MDWQAFALTLRLAAATTATLMCLAVPLSALIVLGPGRWLAALEAVVDSEPSWGGLPCPW